MDENSAISPCASLIEENAILKQRISALEQRVAAIEQDQEREPDDDVGKDRDGDGKHHAIPPSHPPDDLPDDIFLYQSMFEQAPFPIVIFRSDGLVVATNIQNEILLNTPREEIVGKFNMFDDPEAIEKGYVENFERALRGEVARMLPTSYDTIKAGHRGHDDTPVVWTETTYVPLPDRQGRFSYVCEFSMDVTRRVEAEQNLYQAYDQLETLVRERTNELTRAHQELQQTNERLTRLVYDLEQSNRDMTLLNQLGSFLQRSQTLDEAYGVILPLFRQIFPHQSGALYITNTETGLLEAVMRWGDAAPTIRTVAPEHCWALQGGRVHLVEQGDESLQCQHLDGPEPYPYICAQLFSRGETLGLLHLRNVRIRSDQDCDRWERLTMMVADRLSQAIANIQLREQLREQSIRDPLTGLFNRRYLDEILEEEEQRAIHNEYPIGIIMLDIDHFKQCNDRYGHEAGDQVLSNLARLLLTSLRKEDTACRFGGEEFLLILPDVSLEEATACAWNLCNEVRTMPIPHAGTLLDPITISFGVASFPDHGSPVWNVINSADAALYRAKAAGRDRVCVAR